MPTNQQKSRMLRFLDLKERIGGLNPVTLWRWEREGIFPKRIKIGRRSVAWLESEVEEWFASREKSRTGPTSTQPRTGKL